MAGYLRTGFGSFLTANRVYIISVTAKWGIVNRLGVVFYRIRYSLKNHNTVERSSYENSNLLQFFFLNFSNEDCCTVPTIDSSGVYFYATTIK